LRFNDNLATHEHRGDSSDAGGTPAFDGRKRGRDDPLVGRVACAMTARAKPSTPRRLDKPGDDVRHARKPM